MESGCLVRVRTGVSRCHQALRINLKQLGNLWGPLYAVPDGDSFDSLLAIQTEAGILIRAQPNEHERLASAESTEIHKTWTPMIQADLAATTYAATRDLKVPLSFDAKAPLLIGHPSESTLISTLGNKPDGDVSSVSFYKTITVETEKGLKHNKDAGMIFNNSLPLQVDSSTC